MTTIHSVAQFEESKRRYLEAAARFACARQQVAALTETTKRRQASVMNDDRVLAGTNAPARDGIAANILASDEDYQKAASDLAQQQYDLAIAEANMVAHRYSMRMAIAMEGRNDE